MKKAQQLVINGVRKAILITSEFINIVESSSNRSLNRTANASGKYRLYINDPELNYHHHQLHKTDYPSVNINAQVSIPHQSSHLKNCYTKPNRRDQYHDGLDQHICRY